MSLSETPRTLGSQPVVKIADVVNTPSAAKPGLALRTPHALDRDRRR